MSDWRNITLGDFLSIQRGHDLTATERSEGDVPVFGAAGQNGFHDTARAKGPGIVIGRCGGSYGQVHWSESDFWPHNTALYVTDLKGNDPRFAFYVLKRLNFDSFNSGSAQPSLNRNYIYPIPIRVPEPAQQQKIAAVLSALDAKIALNHRINVELEGMAKLLYDYWFVQYDFPLSAAQAAALGQPHLTGQPYRSSGGPMVFDPQLKREIPEGWEVGDLEELCSMVRGVTYSKEDIRTPTYSNTIPILRATNVNNGIVDLSDLVYVTEDMPSEDQYLEKFDILVVMSSGSKAHIGKNALYCYDRKVAYGAFCSKVVPNPSSRFFVAVHMQSDPFKKYISNVCRGTSINNLTNAHITKHQLPIPPKDQLQEFEKTVSSFFETIACNHQQNQELTTLRDWLLPMLMNGQVRVGCSESAESRQKGGAK
jgi:type I restriction enzyme S subunit